MSGNEIREDLGGGLVHFSSATIVARVSIAIVKEKFWTELKGYGIDK